MAGTITLDALLKGCAGDSFDDGIRIDTELVPLAGPGGPVKPAVYEGGTYQHDRRWAAPGDTEATAVLVIDNVPSQANRLEDALRRHRESISIPELVLDLSDLPHLPAHLPRRLSSLEFPHRNADAYLRDAELDGRDFLRTELGQAIFGATAQTCGSPDGVVSAGVAVRVLAVPPGQEAGQHQARSRLGVGDHRLATGVDRHSRPRSEGRRPELEHRRGRDLQPGRPDEVGRRQG